MSQASLKFVRYDYAEYRGVELGSNEAILEVAVNVGSLEELLEQEL